MIACTHLVKDIVYVATSDLQNNVWTRGCPTLPEILGSLRANIIVELKDHAADIDSADFDLGI